MPTPLNPVDTLRHALNAKAPGASATPQNAKKLARACNDFEALFVKYMMQQMRATIPDDGLFGRSQAQEIYTGMLDDEVAKSISHGRGLGLAKAMYAQMAAIRSADTTKK